MTVETLWEWTEYWYQVIQLDRVQPATIQENSQNKNIIFYITSLYIISMETTINEELVKIKSDNLPLGVRWNYHYKDGHIETVFWEWSKFKTECDLEMAFF